MVGIGPAAVGASQYWPQHVLLTNACYTSAQGAQMTRWRHHSTCESSEWHKQCRHSQACQLLMATLLLFDYRVKIKQQAHIQSLWAARQLVSTVSTTAAGQGFSMQHTGHE